MEEESTATYAPVVTGLQEIDVVTGEEDEDLVYSHLCLLYRFTSDAEWKGRGRGDVKLLKHRDTGVCRLVLREDKTFKLRMNAPISPEVELRPQAGSDRAYCWVCTDFSEGNEDGETETFAVKFKTPEIAEEFKAAYDNCGKETAGAQAVEGKAMTNTEAKAFVEELKSGGDVQATVDKYVAAHGVNTLSEDGFTLLMYAIAQKNDEAVSCLTKCPGIKYEVKSGSVWNFEWEEEYYLDGLHDPAFSDEMTAVGSGMTALMIAAAAGTTVAFDMLLKCKASPRAKTNETVAKDVRDFIKVRYDTEGAKHVLTKQITPEEKRMPAARKDSVKSSGGSAKPSPALTSTPAPAAEVPAVAGFKFSSTPSFNFSWGKAAEEKKVVDDAKAIGDMPTDAEELKKALLAERQKNEKVEQMLEDALLELAAIKTERKTLKAELEDKDKSLVEMFERMAMLEGGMMMGEGDEGDEGDYGAEGDDLE